MKKLELSKKIKQIIILILVIILSILVYLLLNTVYSKQLKEETIERYRYSNKAEISYEVFLKPNMVYEDDSLKEGNIYISNLVDYIKLDFDYNFKGNSLANIKGNYEIIAKVLSRVGDKEIWEKKFVLIPSTNIDYKADKFSINDNLKINTNIYADFVNKVNETLNFTNNCKLIIYMNVDINVKTDHGVIEEKLSPFISLPLKANYFEIGGEQIKENDGKIEETININAPIDKRNVISYSVLIVIFLLVLLYILILTKGVVINDILQIELNKIFKKHGDRLVAINDNLDTKCDVLKVKSFDDLVRIADELSKPILYKFYKDYNSITNFYVIDENNIYKFNLKDSIEDETVEIKKEESQNDA